jgi:hypothetical protein
VDDQYVHVLTTMQQGDLMKTSGNNDAALAKYREAQRALQIFRKDHPEWNPKIASFRASLIAEKIAAITGGAPGSMNMPASSETRPSQTAPKASATASGKTVKLLSAGAEPRKILRLHPKAGDKQTAQLTIKMGMEMQMGENQAPAMKLPPMVMTMETTVKDVSSDGDISYDVVISDVTVTDEPGGNPQMVEAMKTQVAAIKGLSGSGVTSSRGVSKKTEMKPPAGADGQTRQFMDQIKESFANVGAPFPEEAVGAGAKWETRAPIRSQGLTINQSSSYQLLSIEGDRVSAKVAINQSAANQKISNPAMPNVKMDLVKMTGTSTGEATYDLTQLMPVSGNTDMHSELLMGGMTGAQKQNMTMKMDMNMRMESK